MMIYEITSTQSTDRFFCAEEGAALQAVRRSAEECAKEYGVDYSITKWDEDCIIIDVPAGQTFYMQRHPVL